MLILAAVAMLAAVVSADPVAVEKRADGVTVVKDLSHKWRGTFETPVMWENVDLTNCKQIADGVESGFEPAWTVLNPLVRKGEGSSGGIYVFPERVEDIARMASFKAAAKAESVKGLVPISFEMP